MISSIAGDLHWQFDAWVNAQLNASAGARVSTQGCASGELRGRAAARTNVGQVCREKIFVSPNVLLKRGEIHLWRLRFSQWRLDREYFTILLSRDESIRAEKFHADEIRNQFVIGRGILRTILGAYLALDPRGVCFGYGRHGKPMLSRVHHADDLQFNLSHSGDWLLCALTRGHAIGVDVEQLRPTLDQAGIAACIFSDADRAAFDREPKHLQLKKLFEAWVHKEAYVKALGLGLSQALAAIEIKASEMAPFWTAIGTSSAIWHAQAITLPDNYAAALVIQQPAHEIIFLDGNEQ